MIEVSVTIDMHGAMERFGPTAVARAQRALTDAVATDCRPEVPVRSGDLQRSMTVTDPKTIEWTEDYAEYAYQRSSKPFWCERAKEKHLDEWRRVCEEALK